jgi:hypothetical protein
MGKLTITSGGTDGLYTANIEYKRDRIDAEIANIDIKITALTAELATATPERYNFINSRLLELESRKKALVNSPDEESISVWCADLTEDLTGTVGSSEVPNERTTGGINILPGYAGNTYNQSTHGILAYPIENTASGAVFNFVIRPWWQKYKPTFRYGTITSIDYDADTCNLTLDAAVSTSQGIDVNQSTTLSGVSISYMDCDSDAFVVGDEVLIKFTNQSWSTPVVIGFKDHPKPCISLDYYILIGIGTIDPKFCIVWNPILNAIQPIFDPVGGAEISQPCDCLNDAAFIRWYAAHSSASSNDCYTETAAGVTFAFFMSSFPSCNDSTEYPINIGCESIENATKQTSCYDSTSEFPENYQYLLDDPEYAAEACEIFCDGLGETCSGGYYTSWIKKISHNPALAITPGALYSGYSKKLTIDTAEANGETSCIRTTYDTYEYGWNLMVNCSGGNYLADAGTDYDSGHAARSKYFPANFDTIINMASNRTDEIFDFKAKFLDTVMIQIGMEEHQNGTPVLIGLSDYYEDGATNHDPREQLPNDDLTTELETMVSFARTTGGLASDQTIKYLFFEPAYISSGAQYGYINIWFRNK